MYFIPIFAAFAPQYLWIFRSVVGRWDSRRDAGELVEGRWRANQLLPPLRSARRALRERCTGSSSGAAHALQHRVRESGTDVLAVVEARGDTLTRGADLLPAQQTALDQLEFGGPGACRLSRKSGG